MPFIELVAQRRPPTAPPGMQPPENAKDWFRIENSVEEEDATDVYVYQSIGGWFGMWAEDFISELKQVATSKINLRLNSPGGSVFDGIAIANAIRSHPAKVTVYVDSLAASIASVIALAGDRVVMMPQSQFMVHNASGACYGDATEMTKTADLLDKQSRNIAEAYAQHTGGTVADWQDYMAAETWFTAEEALAVGLADEVMPMRPKTEDADAEPEPASAMAQMGRSWDLSMYTYAGRDAAPAPDIKSPTATTAAAGQVITIDMLKGLNLDEQILDLVRASIRTRAELPVEEALVTEVPEDSTHEDVEDATTPPAPAEEPEPDEDEPEEEPDETPAKASAQDDLDTVQGLQSGDGNAPTEHGTDTGLGNTEAVVEDTETHDADDDWHGLVDRITTPPSSADDVFNSLKEEWQ